MTTMLFSASRCRALGVLALLIVSALPQPAAGEDEGPIVIAHRGASGYFPEHTLEAYAFAYALGADYIEPDLVKTKDGHLICRHERHLDNTTNVAELFPDRSRSDGHFYAADFTLAEVKRMNAHDQMPNRYPRGATRFEIPTFEELIEMVQHLNRVMGRNVGLYPELKSPAAHREEGLPLESHVIDVLKKYGYEGKDAKIFLQCFEIEPLRYIRNKLHSELPLIMLIGGGGSDDLLSEDGLKDLAQFANGIGPAKGIIERDPALVTRAHAAGLKVHPYTFRADSIARGYDTFEEEVKRFIHDYNVDGLFTDHPDQAVAAMK